MKKLILTALMGVLCIISFAQTITIKDAETQEPLEWATLSSEKPRVFTTTNAKGMADISKFKGSELIEIRSLGYKTLRFTYAQLEAKSFLLYMETTNLNLDEVVVSATRWKQSSRNVPAKITSITRKEAALQNPQTAADLLTVSDEVYVQKSQQGGGSPMIRGFSTNRLLYSIDGVRMNTAIFRGGNLQNVISLDPFAIENTEVLFGPGSVIYGSDAIGGVMSFQTLVPELSLDDKPLITGSAVTRYSSANNERTAHFDVNLGFKKWALVTSLSSNQFDDLRQGSNGPDDYLKGYYVQRIDSVDKVIQQDDELIQRPSAYSQINFMQKVRFQPNDKWDFQYGFHLSETSPYGRYDRHNRVRNGTARYAEWSYGPQKWMMNHLNVVHTGNNKLYDQMTLRIAQQSFEESRIDRSLNKDDRSTNTEEVEAYSANIDFNKGLGEKHTLFYGAEFVFNEVTSFGEIEDITTGAVTAGPSRYPNSDWTSMAIYINEEYKITPKTSVQAGARYNHFLLNATFNNQFYNFPFEKAELNNGAVTGSFGVVHRPTDKWVLSLNVGTAFRSPNVDDIGKVFDSEPGSVVVPNPDLEAEYAYNVDVGVAKVFGDFLKLDLTGYYTILENALVRRDYQLNGLDSIVYDGQLSQVQALQNAAVANVYGIQAGIEIKLPQGFTLSSNYNYQVGEEELDNGETSASRHAAPGFGSTRFTYNANKLMIQFYSLYQAERSHEDLAESEKGKSEIYAADSDGNTYSPSWYTLNVKGMYQFTEHFTVSAGLENITDQRYRTYSSGISAPGRNFIISLRADF